MRIRSHSINAIAASSLLACTRAHEGSITVYPVLGNVEISGYLAAARKPFPDVQVRLHFSSGGMAARRHA